MFAVTTTFVAALRQAHTAVVQVDAWRSGSLVKASLPILDGAVTVDSGSKVRRVLNLTLGPEAGLWDLLAPTGTELRPKRGIRYPSGDVEWVPLGRFDVDTQAMGYAPGGTMTLTAPDRWVRVQRAKFEAPKESVPGATIRSEISRLVLEAVPGVTVTDTATSTATIGAVAWDTDRDAAVEAMAKAIGAEVFFDVDGNLVIRDVPTLTSRPSSWLVDASATGVLLDADRERNRQRTYNVVVVTSTTVDGSVPFSPVTVADNDATSPTYVGGAFGRVPYFYSDPLIKTTGQATSAGTTILERVRGLAAQLSLTSVVNPALDSGDVIDALLPRERPDMDRPVERHLVDKITVPLTIGGTQSVATRSSRPEE